MDEPIGQFKAIKPMLSGSAALVEGYAAPHAQEAKYTQIALREMSEIVAVWYRGLTLLNRAIRREHDSGIKGPIDAWYARDLRLRLPLSTTRLRRFPSFHQEQGPSRKPPFVKNHGCG